MPVENLRKTKLSHSFATTRLPVPEPEIDLCFWEIRGHLRTGTFPWGRRQWAQPSRIRRPCEAWGAVFQGKRIEEDVEEGLV